MKIFEDLDALQYAVDLTAEVYKQTETFPKNEMYGLISQLRRAAGSVASHIAEGQGRLSFGEWRQMLSQARGSLYEVQAHVIVSTRLGFISDDQAKCLQALTAKAARPLAGLIRYVRKQEFKHRQSRSRKRTSNQEPATSNQ